MRKAYPEPRPFAVTKSGFTSLSAVDCYVPEDHAVDDDDDDDDNFGHPTLGRVDSEILELQIAKARQDCNNAGKRSCLFRKDIAQSHHAV